MGRRNFTSEFKVEAASLVLDRGLTVSEACEAVGVGDSAMRRWVKQLESERAGKTPSGRPMTPEQQRIRELERQVERLQEEKDILKKATAFFAKEQGR